MKLLIIVPSNERGGAEEYALRIAVAAKRQWDVQVAMPRSKGTASLVRDLTAEGIAFHGLNIPDRHFLSLKEEARWKQAPSATWSLVLRSLQFVERNYRRAAEANRALRHFGMTLLLLLRRRPDVVLVDLPWPTFGLGIILACALIKIPAAVVFQLYPFPLSFRKSKVRLFRWARARSQQWIAVSEDNRRLICGSFHSTPVEIIRIYNGFDKIHVNDNSGAGGRANLRARVRRDLGVPENSRLLLTVGRLDSQKGFDDLIPAIPHILREFPNTWFVWLGNDDQRSLYQLQLQAYGVSERVFLLGYRSDVPLFMKSADLLITPSRFEGFPFVILEAMSMGLPIVSTAAGGIPEILQNEVHGLVTRVGDSCEMLEAIRRALRHPRLMRAMARKAGGRVRDFSEERMIGETLEVIGKLGAEGRARALR